MPYKDPAVAAEKTKERLRRLRTKPGYSTAKNRAWQVANPEKRAAHRAVERALKSGTLDKKSCEACGSDKVQAHHDDYAKKLQVRWVCQKHHMAIHHNQA